MKIKLTEKQMEFMIGLEDKLVREMYYRGIKSFKGDEEAFLKKAKQILEYQQKKLVVSK